MGESTPAKMWDPVPHLALLDDSAELWARLEGTFSFVGLAVARWHPREAHLLPAFAGPILVNVHSKDACGVYGALRMARRDLGPWLGLANSRHNDERAGPTPDAVHVLGDNNSLPAESVSELRWACADSLEKRLIALLGERELHVALRSAIRRILKQRPPIQRSGVTNSLAAEIGMSLSHLARLATAAQVHLSGLHDLWRLLQAVVLFTDLGTWERAAHELGYSSQAGLNGLSGRCLGRSPGELQEPGLAIPEMEGRVRDALKWPIS